PLRAIAVRAARDVEQGARRRVGKLRRVANRARISGERVDGRDDRRRDAGAAEDVPVRAPARAVAVVDGDARVRVRHRRDVGDRAAPAAGILLPGRLRDQRAAPAAGTAPRGLAPAAGGCGRPQARAADGDDRVVGGRYLDAVAAVAGACGDRDAGVAVRAAVARLTEELAAAVAVADRVRAQRVSLVGCRAEVGEAVRVGLDEQDLAVRTDCGGHLDVELDLLAPARVGSWRRRSAPLIDLVEAAVRGRARRQPALG